MKEKFYIIHGWDGSPDDGWFPWLKKELQSEGYEVFVPAMPDSENPKIDAWVGYIAEVVVDVDENTYFVGHSIGCQVILRYLETLDNKKIGGVVFVAGWFVLKGLKTKEEKEISMPWIERPINFEKILKTTHNFTAIFSDNDPFVPFEQNREKFEKELDAKIIVEKGKGHFSDEEGITELPSVLEAVLNYR